MDPKTVQKIFQKSISKQKSVLKSKFHGLIKDKNLDGIKNMQIEFLIDPNEELSQAGYFWSALHYAVYFESIEILEYLIQFAYRKDKDQYIQVINCLTKEDYTPLALAMIYGKLESIKLLFKYGGVSLQQKDNLNSRTPIQLANSYKRYEAEKIYKVYVDKYSNNYEIYPIQIQEFTNLPSYEEMIQKLRENELSDIQKIQFRSLLLQGERYPCMVCSSDMGYLKYTQCCGNPLHGNCIKKINQCSKCKKIEIKLTDQIKNPENAFFLTQTIQQQ